MTSWVSSSSSEKAPRCSCSCHSTKQTSARRWERSFAALAQKRLHITRMRDKCLKGFNETVIVDDLYPADGVGLMLRKYVHVANNTFGWFPEWWWHCRVCWNHAGFYEVSWVVLLMITYIWLSCIITYLTLLYPTTVSFVPSKVLIQFPTENTETFLSTFCLCALENQGTLSGSYTLLHKD